MWKKKNRYRVKFRRLYPKLDIFNLLDVKKETLIETKEVIEEKIALLPKETNNPGTTKMTNLECIYYTNQTYLSYNPYGLKAAINNSTVFCQDCLCPHDYCANKVFGGDMMYFFQKSSMQFGIQDFGLDFFTEPIQNTTQDITERIHKYWNELYSKLVFAKSVSNGVDITTHHPLSKYPMIEIPNCIERGAFSDFLEWKDVEVNMFYVYQSAGEEYQPDELFIKYFVEH